MRAGEAVLSLTPGALSLSEQNPTPQGWPGSKPCPPGTTPHPGATEGRGEESLARQRLPRRPDRQTITGQTGHHRADRPSRQRFIQPSPYINSTASSPAQSEGTGRARGHSTRGHQRPGQSAGRPSRHASCREAGTRRSDSSAISRPDCRWATRFTNLALSCSRNTNLIF